MSRSGREIAVLWLVLLLAGCASGPKPLPTCEGPWVPINAQGEGERVAGQG